MGITQQTTEPTLVYISMIHQMLFILVPVFLLVGLPSVFSHGFHGPWVPHFNYLSYGYTEKELEEYKAITAAEPGVMIQERVVRGDDCFCRVPEPSSAIPSCPSDDSVRPVPSFLFGSTGRGGSSSSDYYLY